LLSGYFSTAILFMSKYYRNSELSKLAKTNDHQIFMEASQ
jgi:hypothetical protein